MKESRTVRGVGEGGLCCIVFLQVPSGLLPALEYKGKLYTESASIMFLLEDEFPDFTPLLPAYGTPERQRAERLLQVERALFSDWLQWLCSSW
jgi:glutathione S-transferase